MRRVSDEQKLINAASGLRDPLARRSFLKLATLAGAGIAAAPLLAACNRESAAMSGTIRSATGVDLQTGRISQQIYGLTNDYWNSWNAGYEAATKALQCNARQFYHDNDPAKQVGQLQTVKATGSRMLIGAPATAGIVPAMARTVQENQTYWVPSWELQPWLTPIDVGDFLVAHVTPPSEKIAYEVATELFRQIGNAGKVVHIAGLRGSTPDLYRSAGLARAVAENPGIELVGGLYGEWDREKSRSVMLNMVTAYPDMVAVFAQSDAQANGVLSVLEERNMRHVKVSGIDGNKENLQKIMTGPNMAVTHMSVPPHLAAYSAVAVFDALNGWKPALPERMMYQESTLITRENAEAAYDKVYRGRLPYDVAKMSRTLNPRDWDPQNLMIPIDPELHWRGLDKAGRSLNGAYSEPGFKAEFNRVAAEYADRYRSGPFKS